MAKNKKQSSLEREQVLSLYMEFKSASLVAKKLGVTRQAVSDKLKYMRKQGVNVPRFGHDVRVKNSVANLNEIVKNAGLDQVKRLKKLGVKTKA